MDHPFPVRETHQPEDEPVDHRAEILRLADLGRPDDEFAIRALRAVQARPYAKRLEANRAARVDRERARRGRFDDLSTVDRWPARHLNVAARPHELSEAEKRLGAALDRDPPPRFVALLGPTGTGKTTAAVVYAWEPFRRPGLSSYVHGESPIAGGWPAFVTANDLVTSWIEPAQRFGADSRPPLHEHLGDASILIVDEVGAESAPSAKVAAFWDYFIDRRHAASAPGTLILTSNLTLSQLEERFGERAWRRIRDLGRAVPLTSTATIPAETRAEPLA